MSVPRLAASRLGACATLLLAAPLAAPQAPLLDFAGNFHGQQSGTALALYDRSVDFVPDIIVGCPEDDTNGEDAGAVYIHDGVTGALVRKHLGTSPGDRFGSAVVVVGDANGDNYKDYAISAPYRSEGVVYVYSYTGSLIQTHVGASVGERFGASLACIGEVDFHPVLAIGAPYADVAAGADAGRVSFRWASGPGSPLSPNFRNGAQAGEHFGSTLDARLGQLVVGAPDYDTASLANAGRFEALWTDASAVVPTFHVRWSVAGTSAGARLGSAVGIGYWSTGAGDVGQLSFLAGAPGAATPYFVAYRDNAGSAQNLITLTGSGGFGSAIAAGGNGSFQPYFVAVGAPEGTLGGVATGRVYRYEHGSLAQVLNGAASGERFGAALAGTLGDSGSFSSASFLAVGAPGADMASPDDGRTELHLPAGLQLAVAGEPTLGDRAGTSVAGLGDVNGDGVPDILVGSPRDDRLPSILLPIELTDCGAARVVSGASGDVLRTHYGSDDGDLLGSAVVALGDINLDQVTDYAVGAPQDDNAATQAGYVQVRSGATGSLLFTVNGAVDGIGYGSVLGGGSDLNGDGRRDLLVGAPTSANGTVYAYSGVTGLLIGGLSGAAAGDRFGAALAGLGDDLDGDGKDEYVVGAPGCDVLGKSNAGRAYVLKSITSLATIVVSAGFAADDEAGSAVAAAGDVNQDGKLDVLVGIPGYDGPAGTATGRVRVLSGTGPFEVQLASVTGAEADDRLGSAVVGLGDVDQDGWPDWAAGALQAGVLSVTEGYAVVFSGFDETQLGRVDGEAYDHLGQSLAATGDVDLDGVPDLVVGAPGAVTDHHDAGLARIYSLVPVAPVWTDLGHALAGTPGEPLLVGAGTLLAGSAGSLTLSNAQPSALACLFVALADGSQPFKGGTLVPLPPLLMVVLATSPAGDMPLAWAAWPAGLSGLGLHFQYAIQDAGAVQGLALSNALRADVP